MTNAVEYDPKSDILKVSCHNHIKKWGKELKGPQNQYCAYISVIINFFKKNYRAKEFLHKKDLILFFDMTHRAPATEHPSL